MKRAKIIFHIGYEFFRTETIESESIDEIVSYIEEKGKELSECCEIPIEVIRYNLTIEELKK
ncbi:MAG: hypothetical protein IKY67_02685 [Paludibacteraceae bacterium]|nr:hypothetical protein [Paludibacteraceae bacterium]